MHNDETGSMTLSETPPQRHVRSSTTSNQTTKQDPSPYRFFFPIFKGAPRNVAPKASPNGLSRMPELPNPFFAFGSLLGILLSGRVPNGCRGSVAACVGKFGLDGLDGSQWTFRSSDRPTQPTPNGGRWCCSPRRSRRRDPLHARDPQRERQR